MFAKYFGRMTSQLHHSDITVTSELLWLQVYDVIGVGAWQPVSGMLCQFSILYKLMFFNNNFRARLFKASLA